MKVIITGATGMVGEGVLHICLRHAYIEEVLVIAKGNLYIWHNNALMVYDIKN